jgi:hypothetical protein
LRVAGDGAVPVRNRRHLGDAWAPGGIYADSALGYSDVAGLLSTRLASMVPRGPPARALMAPSLLATVGDPGVACSKVPPTHTGSACLCRCAASTHERSVVSCGCGTRSSCSTVCRCVCDTCGRNSISKRLPFMGAGWVATRRATCLCDYHLRVGVESRAVASLAMNPSGKTVTGTWSPAEEDALHGFLQETPPRSAELIGRHLCREASSVNGTGAVAQSACGLLQVSVRRLKSTASNEPE